MSELVSSSQFDEKLNLWLDAFPIAAKDQRTHFYYDLKEEFKMLRYFEMHKGKITVQRHPMVEITSSFKISRRNADMVLFDLNTVWSSFVGSKDRAMISIVRTEEGFNVLFAHVPSNAYVLSGTMQVQALRD